jgi:hypothetical protein
MDLSIEDGVSPGQTSSGADSFLRLRKLTSGQAYSRAEENACELNGASE